MTHPRRALELTLLAGLTAAAALPMRPRTAHGAPASPIRFRDAAAAAGLVFVHENHPTPRKHLIETVPGGVAAFDYDGDGRTDVFFTNGAAIPSLEKEGTKYWNRLYRNEGGLRFKDVTQAAGLAGTGYAMGAASGDFDNDGRADLFVAGVGHSTLYHNTGQGTFEDVTARAGLKPLGWSVAAGFFDYDNDGWLDLFVVNYLQWTPDLDRFCGDPLGKVRVYCHPKYFRGLPNALYRNRGDGSFEDVSERSGIARHVGKGMSVAFADYDKDGFLDVFVSNDAVPNFLFHNRGDGTFEEVGLLSGVAVPENGQAVSGMGVDFRDYDDDGLPDLHLTALARQTFPLFRNEGRGAFRDATVSSGLAAATLARSGWSNALADFDNDGHKDLFAAGGHVNDEIERFEATKYRLPNALFRNVGGGRFEDVSAEAGADFQRPRAHRGAAVADFDGDGRLDVVVSALGEPAELWVNESARPNHWLVLKPRGTRSNRDGIGAVVRVAGQTNHMTTAVGYASSSHAGVHFGLGGADRVDVEITWPSGVVQRLAGVAADQVLRVEEPASASRP